VGEANLIPGVPEGTGVATALGPITFAPADQSGPLTVLVRPEQIDVHPGTDGPGSPGRVISTDFYGHDAVVHVSLEDGASLGAGDAPTVVVARVLGGIRLAPGSAVTLTVRGAVGAWPTGQVPGALSDAPGTPV
jgi:hypothetical protein